MIGDVAFNRGDLKYKVELAATGFDIETDDYGFELHCGAKRVRVPQEAVVVRDNDVFVCLTVQMLAPLGSGELYLVGFVSVPDQDFASGSRREVCKVKLTNLEVM